MKTLYIIEYDWLAAPVGDRPFGPIFLVTDTLSQTFTQPGIDLITAAKQMDGINCSVGVSMQNVVLFEFKKGPNSIRFVIGSFCKQGLFCYLRDVLRTLPYFLKQRPDYFDAATVIGELL